MICANPFTKGAQAYPCGACAACRQKRNLIWKTRLILESMSHLHTSFVTLTYRPEEMPYTQDGLPTLIPSDLRNWLKRFREAIKPSTIRFYAVGEYGEKHDRPHYHALIFGYKGCAYGSSRYSDGRTIDCCASCDTVRDTWKHGIIECKPMSPEHAGYVSGYVLKRMTNPHDNRLQGRHPEFSRMSNQNGGIGIKSVPDLARISSKRIASGTHDDVASAVRINGIPMQIGVYLRRRIRKQLGGDGKAPPSVIAQMEAEMLPLLYASKTDREAITLKKQIVKLSEGKLASIKARQAINNRRKRNETL